MERTRHLSVQRQQDLKEINSNFHLPEIKLTVITQYFKLGKQSDIWLWQETTNKVALEPRVMDGYLYGIPEARSDLEFVRFSFHGRKCKQQGHIKSTSGNVVG